MQASFLSTPLPLSSLSDASSSIDARARHHYNGRAHIGVSAWPRTRAPHPPTVAHRPRPPPAVAARLAWWEDAAGRRRLVLPHVQEQAVTPLHGEDKSQLGRDSGLPGCAVKKQAFFHVAIKCSMCSRYSWRVLQAFHVDVAKVDLNVAMLRMLHTHFASV
jgi:hypothetical protein